jgi:acetyl-CoA carboxylase carboxyl transferase subunit alpha
VIDEIIPEPLGGAHRDPKRAIAVTGDAVERALRALVGIEGGILRQRRREKFLEMGQKGL